MADSLLKGLKARRDTIAAEHVAELPVPLVDGVRLRVKALDHEALDRQHRRLEKVSLGARGAVTLDVNAAIVGLATTAVLVGDGDDQETYDPLDPDVKAEFGLPESASAADVIRALTVRDGDVIALATAVMKHSGYGQDAADEALAGE